MDKYGGYTGKKWIKNNKKTLNKNNHKNFQELYLPRVTANFWMEDKLINLIRIIEKINKNSRLFIKINFFAGEVTDISDNKKYRQIRFKNNKCYKLNYWIKKDSLKKFHFYKTGLTLSSINSFSQSIGIGLTTPKQIASNRAQLNKNYIWDFYDEGSTSGLLKKLEKSIRNQSKFILLVTRQVCLSLCLNFLKISKRLNQKLKFIVPLGILKQFKWLNILQIKKIIIYVSYQIKI